MTSTISILQCDKSNRRESVDCRRSLRITKYIDMSALLTTEVNYTNTVIACYIYEPFQRVVAPTAERTRRRSIRQP